MKTKFGSIVSLAILLIGISGCAYYTDGRPAVKFYQVTAEAKLKSAKHWRVVADDVVENIGSTLKVNKLPFFLEDIENATTFDRVFSNQLRSSLYASGASVASKPEGALQIKTKVVTVRHIPTVNYLPGSLTALSAGVMVLREAMNSTVAGIIATDALASAAEITTVPDTEVVLTISIEENGLFVLHTTETYYVDGVDRCLFKPVYSDAYSPCAN